MPCSIADIVQTAINLARPQATRSGVEIVFDRGASGALIRPCEPRLVESAISNLIQNALRYSGSKDVKINVSATPTGKVSICVRDHGVGIPPDCQPRLFERFYRVDKDRSRALGGTGLGLAIVKHIAQFHGGTVTVSSSSGQGAAFTITI